MCRNDGNDGNIFFIKNEKIVMRTFCTFLFFMNLSFSVSSQQAADTTIHKTNTAPLQSNHFKNSDSSIVDKNKKIINSSDSTSGKLKSKISKAYKKLDNYPLTHKYIKQIDELGGKVNSKYKKYDSLAHADTGSIAKVIALQQSISKTLKSRKEIRDSINNYQLVSSNSIKKADTISSIHVPSEIKVAEKQNPQEKAAIEFVNAGTLYLGLNKSKEAIVNFEKGLHIAQQIHSLDIIQHALKGLSDAYAQKSDVKKALSYYKQYTEVKDSLLKLKTDQAIGELKTKYESEKKQREIQTLVLEGQKKKSELNKTLGQIQEQKQVIVLIVLALFLTIILALTLFRQYRSKKKNNEILQIQNDKIVEQKKELEESLTYTKQLQEALREDLDHYMQVALRKQMNPHFIFNSLNSIQSFILQNDKLSANIYLSKFAGLMRKVLENSQHHLITLEKEIEVLKLYIELEEQRFDNKFICSWIIDSNVDLSSHKLPPLILQPYIENAIWHGLLHKEGERMLTIRIMKKAEQLICTIEDNGVGRVAAMAISKNKSNHESLGTKITQKRIDLINSLNKSGIGVQYFDLCDEDGLANGTRVELTIPVIGEF